MKNKIILIIFAVCLTFVIVVSVIFNFVLYPKKHANFVYKYSEEFNIEPALVFAIIKAESDFDKNAKSKAGALGLMQILPTTAKWIAEEFEENYLEESLFDEETNIRYGCFYLNYLFSKFSDKWAVVCAYNAGETVVRNWISEDKLDISKVSYAETKKYLLNVKKFYTVYVNSKICF